MSATTSGDFNLTHFGWDNLIVPSNLQHLCAYLPKWHDIKALRAPVFLNSDHPEVVFPHTLFQNDPVDGGPFLPAFEKGARHSRLGGYAQIYRGKRAVFKPLGAATSAVSRLVRTTPFTPMCIKEVPLKLDADEDESAYEEECRAILYEAYLHALLMKFLETQGLKTTVPHLYEITATTITQNPPTDASDFDAIWMTMEFIEGETLEEHLLHVLEVGNTAKNDVVILDILLQLAHILNLLQSALRFNHRDLKINNLFIRSHPAAGDAWLREVPAGDGEHIWKCRRDLVLIDFGFSCIACGTGFENPRATLVGAGSYYNAEHDCMKVGRDLAHFLYSLHAAFPLQSYLSPALFAALHAAVRATRAGVEVDLWRGFAEDGTPLGGGSGPLPLSVPFHNGIYAFLREGDTDVPGCAPTTLAATLAPFARGVGL